MTVRYTATAVGEITDLLSFIANDRPTAAADFLQELERTISLVAARPLLAPVVFEGEVRAKLVGRYQVRIFYVVAGDDLIIRNVRSTRRLRPWEREGDGEG